MRLRRPPADAADGAPEALACYGTLRADGGVMLVRFVRGRPVSQVTEGFLAWACGRLAAEGERALFLVRDDASWHASRRVRHWIEGHDRRAKAEGGVRTIACYLPVKTPWLEAIEPKWAHGTRTIIEPDRKLSGDEIIERVCGYYGCGRLERLEQQVT